MHRILRVGVIGCGSIAQQMHLPYLTELSDRFRIEWICDVSPTVTKAVQERFHVPHATGDYREVLDQPLDAVLILVSGPAEAIVVAAIERGHAVLVEKPLAWSPRWARIIEERVRERDAIAMVGYMKRFDPGYELFQTLAANNSDRWKLVLCHDVAGPNDPFIRDVAVVTPGTDIPDNIRQETGRLAGERVREALGDVPNAFQSAYTLLLGLCSHDLAILRGVLGKPIGVRNCHVFEDGRFVTAELEYEGGPVMFESGLVDLKRFDERIELFGADQMLKVSFPSPFIKNAPTLVDEAHMVGEALAETRYTASYEEAFRRELLHFHQAVSDHRPPLTSVTDAREDTELMATMIRKAFDTDEGGVQ